MLIYLWLFAFTRFLRKIPLCINELDMAGHVWCDECYLVDWLLLHGFIPHHSVRYKYHHQMQVKLHTLKYTFTAIKELLQPCSKLLGANAIAIVEIMHFPYFSHGTVSTSWIRVLWQSTLLGEEGAAAPLLQPVHSQVFLLGEVDYELALSVSPCGHFLKTTDLYYRHLFSFQKFEISLNP